MVVDPVAHVTFPKFAAAATLERDGTTYYFVADKTRLEFEAKAVDLTPESEPDIFGALRFGAVLENVAYDTESHHVDFTDTRITQNTRGAYPIDYVGNARIPCFADHPTEVIFLTCDAFGVLPPVARLTPGQAMYHFVSGHTAKVAGTEMSVTEPQAAFSPCFGGPLLVWHPMKYAGRLADAPTAPDPFFGFDVVTECPGVPNDVLTPRNTWADPAAYEATTRMLAGLFRDNFRQFADKVDDDVRAAAPRLSSVRRLPFEQQP